MSFGNPILGSDDTLIRDAIQSEGFAVGVSGWRIERDGDAEFNDATVRGAIIILNGSGDEVGRWNAADGLKIRQPSSGRYVRVRDDAIVFEDETDTDNLNYLQHQEIGMSTNGSAYSLLANGTGNGGDLAGGGNWRIRSAGEVVRVEGSFLKYMHLLGNVETWNSMTLPGGYGELTSCDYKLYPDGMVRLRGIADATPGAGGPGAALAAGTVITTLPAGYRPVQDHLFVIAFDSSATKGRVIVRTTGNVEIYDAPNDRPSLDGIEFDTQT